MEVPTPPLREYNYRIMFMFSIIKSFPPKRISKEVDTTESMIERVEERFDLKPDRVAGDVAYGTGETLAWLLAQEIDPHIPLRDQSKVAAVGWLGERGREPKLTWPSKCGAPSVSGLRCS